MTTNNNRIIVEQQKMANTGSCKIMTSDFSSFFYAEVYEADVKIQNFICTDKIITF